MSDPNEEIYVASEELTALKELAESADPMARVLFHMSNRQLAMSERQVRMENEILRMSGRQDRLILVLEKAFSNGGSKSNMRAVNLEGC